MSRVPFVLLLALACTSVVAAEPSHTPDPDVATIDLRVGLSRSAMQPGYLAHGVGQGGFVELDKGHVVGALLPLSNAEDGEYLKLRRALEYTERFEIGACRFRPSKITLWFELESADQLIREPSSVGLWVTRGVRVFALVGTHDNALATAATSIRPGPVTGLSMAGREIASQIIAAGALIDVSNASDRTIDDVIVLARETHTPVIATHSNARALADQPRNLSDDHIREIARSGGVVGVTASHGQLAAGRVATLQHLVRQIVYLVGLAGPEHVALGTGFEAGVTMVRDFRSAADLPRLAHALRHAGLSDHDLELVMHGNARRLLCPEPRESLQ